MRLSVMAAAAGLVVSIASMAAADVAAVSIASKSVVLDGRAFGAAGAYEKLSGTIEFALDPKDPHNAGIVDLDKAVRAADGRVHFTADLYVLRPVDQTKANGVLLFEVANRGNKGLLTRFSSGTASNDPSADTDFGNGFLMREGYTLVWVGWEFDVRPPLVHLDAPLAAGVVGRIAVPLIPDAAAKELVLTDAPLYPPQDPVEPSATLTVRDRFWDKPTPIVRDHWHFVPGSGAPRIALDEGFTPGRIYEVTYTATGARVVGTGLAAIRDAASAFRYRSDLPIRGQSTYVFGASQDGRFLREFLYDGFNVDEQNRRVFDAVWAHIAGGARGSFNERFGMPTALAPFVVTRFPFTNEPEQLGSERKGLLDRYQRDQRPKIVFTNTSVEYWGFGRAAALTHTSTDGRADLTLPSDERIYFLTGTQHGESAFPPTRTRGQQLANPVPQREVMRALLRGLHDWVEKGAAPPASRYPRLSDGTLTPIARLKFPSIPSVSDPRTIVGPALVTTTGVKPLPFLVPQVDADGNELGGIRVPDVQVPVATNAGWNFRSPAIGNPGDIVMLLGSYIPFAATAAERTTRRDPRPSIEERYKNRDEYLQKLKVAAEALVKDRYLLEEDIPNVIRRGEAQWDYVTSHSNP